MKKFFLSTVLALCFFSLPALAQNKWITGRVTDNSGAPVVGATVTVRGATHGATTDADGKYRIQGANDQLLFFQCLGYEPQEVKIGQKTVVNVELADAVEQLENVVVTGYQTISKERATGSFDIVGKDQLEKPTGNIASRLVGAAAGIAATQDAYGNPIFEIRGRSSLTTKATQPLLVVDGFAIEGGFESINPNDVASVSILKDAAAASIWGAKSANGVIVITTKNAQREGGGNATVTVDYSGFFKVSPKMDLDYLMPYASSNDVIDYEVNNWGKFDWSVWIKYHEENEYGGGMSQVYNLLNENRLGHITTEQMNAEIEKYRGLNNKNQIKKYLLQNPIVHQENLAINIATDRSYNTLSAMYQNDRQHYKHNDANKYMVNFRNRTKMFKWLDFTFNGSYTYNKAETSGSGIPGLSPYEMLVDENGDPIRYMNGVSLNYVDRHVPKGAFPYEDWSYNPIEEQENREFLTTTATARIQAGLTFKIWEGLSIDSRVQYEMIDRQARNYYNENTYTVRNTVNQAATWDKTTDKVTPNLPSGGFLDQSRQRYDVVTIRNQINFNHTFADKHSIAFVAGLETIDRRYQTFTYPRTYGYDDNTLSVGRLPNGVGGAGIYKLTNWQGANLTINYLNSFTYDTDRYFSAFGNASYTYDNRYTVSGSMRTDASNLITDDPKYRYAPFWSVGASWQIGNEQFMQGVGWVNSLSLRATFGYNGNVDKSTSFKPLVNVGASNDVITGEPYGSLSSFGNPTLRWEKTGTWDIGVDFNLFRGKLFGKIDVYKKHSEDLIASVSLPQTQGTSSMKLNNGELVNKGIEIEIGSSLRISKNVSWTGTLMLSYNRNRIVSIKQKPTSAYSLVYQLDRYPNQGWMEGYDMNTLWMYKYGGMMNAGTESSPDWQPSILHKSGLRETFQYWNTGDPLDNAYDMGTLVAPWQMAFTTSFRVYDFDISLIVTGKFGHKFKRQSFNYPSIQGRMLPNEKYRDVINGDPEKIAPMPTKENDDRLYFWDRFYPYLDYLAENAGHLRLQELNVSYNVPMKAVRKIGLRQLQVYLQCNNPFSIYFNKYNEDPEFKKGSLRLQPSYTVGIKCKF